MPFVRSNEEVGPLSPLSVSLAAGFSGSIAAGASHCFDTAKCRSQCTVLPKVCMLLVTGRFNTDDFLFNFFFFLNNYCIILDYLFEFLPILLMFLAFCLWFSHHELKSMAKWRRE